MHKDRLALAKWLDEKLKLPSINEYTISDVFQFAAKTNSWKSVQRYFVLVRVLALVTNVSLEENVWIIENKVFNHNGNWLNNILTYLSC